MTTALDQINAACKLLGVLAAGETLPSEDSIDALAALNQMVDAWSTQGLMIYASQTQELTWPANQGTRTIGPTGDIVATRPIRLDNRTYFKDSSGNSYGLTKISEEDFNAISLKTITSTYPEYFFVNYTMPDITVSVYPVPTLSLTWEVVSDLESTQPATLFDALSVPPGYLRAFKYNLACEIAPIFGITPLAKVEKIATLSLKSIKKSNVKIENLRMNLPSAIPTMGNRGNIFTGE